jgi:hypothetical protein
MAPVEAYATLTRTTVQSIADSTATALLFTSETDDSHGGHDLVTNTSRWYAPYSGRYLMTLNVPWANNATGRRGCWWRINGAGTLYSGGSGPSINASVVTPGAKTIRMTAGDYIEAWGYQTSGGALNADGTLNDGVVWTIDYVGP